MMVNKKKNDIGKCDSVISHKRTNLDVFGGVDLWKSTASLLFLLAGNNKERTHVTVW